MVDYVEFGRLEHANEVRDTVPEAIHPKDDRRKKTIVVKEDIDSDLLDEIEVFAAASVFMVEGENIEWEPADKETMDAVRKAKSWYTGSLNNFQIGQILGYADYFGISNGIEWLDPTLTPDEHYSRAAQQFLGEGGMDAAAAEDSGTFNRPETIRDSMASENAEKNAFDKFQQRIEMEASALNAAERDLFDLCADVGEDGPDALLTALDGDVPDVDDGQEVYDTVTAIVEAFERPPLGSDLRTGREVVEDAAAECGNLFQETDGRVILRNIDGKVTTVIQDDGILTSSNRNELRFGQISQKMRDAVPENKEGVVLRFDVNDNGTYEDLSRDTDPDYRDVPVPILREAREKRQERGMDLGDGPDDESRAEEAEADTGESEPSESDSPDVPPRDEVENLMEAICVGAMERGLNGVDILLDAYRDRMPDFDGTIDIDTGRNTDVFRAEEVRRVVQQTIAAFDEDLVLDAIDECRDRERAMLEEAAERQAEEAAREPEIPDTGADDAMREAATRVRAGVFNEDPLANLFRRFDRNQIRTLTELVEDGDVSEEAIDNFRDALLGVEPAAVETGMRRRPEFEQLVESVGLDDTFSAEEDVPEEDTDDRTLIERFVEAVSPDPTGLVDEFDPAEYEALGDELSAGDVLTDREARRVDDAMSSLADAEIVDLARQTGGGQFLFSIVDAISLSGVEPSWSMPPQAFDVEGRSGGEQAPDLSIGGLDQFPGIELAVEWNARRQPTHYLQVIQELRQRREPDKIPASEVAEIQDFPELREEAINRAQQARERLLSDDDAPAGGTGGAGAGPLAGGGSFGEQGGDRLPTDREMRDDPDDPDFVPTGDRGPARDLNEELERIAENIEYNTRFKVTERPPPQESRALLKRFPTPTKRSSYIRVESMRMNESRDGSLIPPDEWAFNNQDKLEQALLDPEEFIAAQQSRYVGDDIDWSGTGIGF